MPSATQSQWSAMTWPEILERIEAGGDSVILPLGATEQHGPHLTTGMDSILADKLCAAVAERTGVPVLPTLPFGCSIGHSHRWPGTLALSPTTLISLLTDLGEWLHRAGIRRLFLINCHVGNIAPARCALDMLRCRYDDLMVALLNDGDLSPEIARAFSQDAGDWHANAAETSLMMAVAPDSVRSTELATADDPDRTCDCVFSHPVNRTSRNGVTGRPSEASFETGEKLFETLVATLTDKVLRGTSEQAPLDAHYAERI